MRRRTFVTFVKGKIKEKQQKNELFSAGNEPVREIAKNSERRWGFLSHIEQSPNFIKES